MPFEQPFAPKQPPGAPLLQATIAQVAPHVASADNLGRSGDWRDLYYVLDYLCFAVERAYPEIPCTRGCSHCCHNQVFRVSRVEWEAVREGLNALPPERRAAALSRAEAMYGPHRAALEGLADHWTRKEPAPAELHQSAPKSCPMLEDGRCSVYANRPGICRGYGYFSATVGGANSLLICQQEGPDWVSHLEAAAVDVLPMPNWNPVQRHLEALNDGGPIKPLPLWLLDEAAAATAEA